MCPSSRFEAIEIEVRVGCRAHVFRTPRADAARLKASRRRMYHRIKLPSVEHATRQLQCAVLGGVRSPLETPTSGRGMHTQWHSLHTGSY